MKLPIAVFAMIEEKYNHQSGKVEETVCYYLKEWSNADGLAYYKKEGYVLVEVKDVEFEELTHDAVVQGTVEALRARKVQVQAEAQKNLTEIDRKINCLLALEYVPSVDPKGEFAPRSRAQDVTDVDPLTRYDGYHDPDDLQA
jgi:hypothetical protein